MTLTGGQIVARMLARQEIPYFIGIPGHGCLGLIDAFIDQSDVQVMQVRSEQCAVHMADGYYRASGKPLACFTSIGPGALNTAIGLGTCFVDSTPALVVNGDTHTYMSGVGVLQEIERHAPAGNLDALKPLAKHSARAMTAAELPGILHQAFTAMLTGRRGPAVVAVPMDVQAHAAEVDLPDPVSAVPTTLPPDPQAIQQAADMLAGAERPVILAGGGINHAEAWSELLVLAETSGAAVITTFQGKGCFPEDHPQSGWLGGSKGTDVGNHLALNADVLLAVGARFADETTSSYRHGSTYQIPPTRLIHADLEEREIGKNYPVEIGILGDARSVLRDLATALDGRQLASRRDYHAELRGRRDEWNRRLAHFQDRSRQPATISAALSEVRAALPRDALVCTSSGNTQAQVLQEFPFYEPRTNITTAGFSTMGWSLPAALGCRLAHPNRAVVALVGDGDFLMTIHELATAAQYGLPIVAVVFNNQSWQSINDLQMAAYGDERRLACDFERPDGTLYSPDFAALARSFGCAAATVTQAADVGDAVRRAVDSGEPTVIEVPVNRTPPYSGGEAVGWWDVPVPAYLEGRGQYEREREEERLPGKN